MRRKIKDLDNLVIRQKIHKKPRPFYVVRRQDKDGYWYYILILPIYDIQNDIYYYWWWKETDKRIFFEGIPKASYSLSKMMDMGWLFTSDIIEEGKEVEWRYA